MKNLKWLLLSGLLIALQANARSPDCKVEVWKPNPSLPIRQIVAILEHTSRPQIIQLAWGEMLRQDQSRSLALPVLQYLISTEQEKPLRGYYKVLALSITSGLEPRNLLHGWPTRYSQQQKTSLTLPQLCGLYAQSAAAPGPAK
ncbi:MAG: hypothetical protein ACXVA9_02680 [Bdellovibrionales bacterium]